MRSHPWLVRKVRDEAGAPGKERPSEAVGNRWTVRQPRGRGLPRLNRRELWRYRDVAFVLAQRDIRLRYRQTVLGVAWVLLQPLLTVALFSLVFGHLAHVPSDHLPYALFAYGGMVIWTAVSTAVQSGALCLVEARELITKLYFPRLLAPIGAALPSLLDAAIAALGAVILLAAYQASTSPAIFLAPVWLALTIPAALSMSTWLAALNVRYRDVRYLLPFGMQLWFFASPIAYPSGLFHGFARDVYALNPLVGLMDGFRWSLFDGSGLSSADLVSLLSGSLLLVGGTLYFRRTESMFADVI